MSEQWMKEVTASVNVSLYQHFLDVQADRSQQHKPAHVKTSQSSTATSHKQQLCLEKLLLYFSALVVAFFHTFSPLSTPTKMLTQPRPINIWAIKDPTPKGAGHRRLRGLTQDAQGNLDRQGHFNHEASSNLEHKQRQLWPRWWKLLVSSVPAPTRPLPRIISWHLKK